MSQSWSLSLESDDELRTVNEVAVALRVSKMTIYRLVHGGELNAVRIGRSFRVPESAIRAYLERVASGSPA
jgi:excisionase family DNA binding protein